MPDFAISTYPDTTEVTNRLDELAKLPVYGVKPDILRKYESEYYTAKCPKSMEIAAAAKERVPGGIRHGELAGQPFPPVFARAEGAYLHDVDGNRYYDLCQADGASILGNNPTAVRGKIMGLLNDAGPLAGMFHEYEYRLADKICGMMPTVQMFRMLASSTEACMAAIRVARLATGKTRILKMSGAYHGWSDQLVHGTLLPGLKPMKAYGIPNFCLKGTKEFSSGDLDAAEKLLRGGKTAAVIMEPLGAKSGATPLDTGFNKALEALCRKYGALLIFDETDTAFRLGVPGAQGYFDVLPDMTVFGASVAGGYQCAGGIGGKREYMKYLEDTQAGKKTHNALGGGLSPASVVSCAAGYYTLCEVEDTGAAKKAGLAGDRVTAGLKSLIEKYNLPFAAYNYGSICHLDTTGAARLAAERVKPWQTHGVLKHIAARKREAERFGAACVAEGLVTAEDNRIYTSAAYTDEMIDDVLQCFDRVLSNMETL